MSYTVLTRGRRSARALLFFQDHDSKPVSESRFLFSSCSLFC